MINGLSFDIEDWFQVENLKEACPFSNWDRFETRVEQNTEILLQLLNKYHRKATFFILGWIAERKPNLVRRIFQENHEIASHGYKHEVVYRISANAFREDVSRSKELLEDIIGAKVIGYRAPNFSISKNSLWALDILKECGFAYDSSIFPTSFHDRYGFEGIRENSIFKFQNGLFELPLTVYKLGKFNFPLGGGAYFRLFPYALFKALLRRINRKGDNFIFYLHPWELDSEQPKVKIRRQYYFRHYINLHTTKHKLTKLIRDFDFQPLKNLLNE